MRKKIISPCISICKTDPVTGYCYGCARTNEEKKKWKDENISDAQAAFYKRARLNSLATKGN